MKNLIKLFLVIILTLTISTAFPVSVFAYEYGTPDLDEMVQVKTNGNTKTHSFDRVSINRIKNSRSKKYKNKSDEQKLKEIFDALELKIDNLQFEQISKDLKLSHISDISVKTQYIKVNAEGENSNISESEAFEIVEKEKKLLTSSHTNYSLATTAETSDTSPTTSHGSPPETVADGCMQMQITAIYTPNYNGTGTTIGRYCFLGSCLWLTTPDPLQRTTNTICFYSPDFRWPDKRLDSNENSNYVSIFSYVEYVYDSNSNLVSYENLSEVKHESDAVVSSEKGVFFEHDLPNNKVLMPIIYGDFSFLVFAVGNVHNYNNADQNISIDFKYTFLTNPLSISPSFSWGPVGVSVSFMHGPEEYVTHHTWDYHNDYYA